MNWISWENVCFAELTRLRRKTYPDISQGYSHIVRIQQYAIRMRPCRSCHWSFVISRPDMICILYTAYIYIYLYTPLQHVTNEPSTATGEGPNTRLRHCSASVPSGGWHCGKPLWKFFYPLFGSPQNHTIPSGQIIATSHDLTLKGSYNLARYNSMLGGIEDHIFQMDWLKPP